MKKNYNGITLRPSDILCLICSLGENPFEVKSPELKKMLDVISKNPETPITLRCNAGDVFSYQNIKNKSTGNIFERKKDLEILQRLDFPPGITITARILINRILNRITTVKGICWYDESTSEKWLCPKARKSYYEKSRKAQLSFIMQHCGEIKKSIAIKKTLEKGIKIIIPPRSIDDIRKSKKVSINEMHKEKNKGIRIRPHLLLCAMCQYGGGIKPGDVYDNLPEFVRMIIKEPFVMVKMVEGADWMMCAPCPAWNKNMCTHSLGSGGLSNQLRDMRVLQKLGLRYGSLVKAGDLYRLIYKKIHSTLEICRFDNLYPSVWYSGCGQRKIGNPDYRKGIKKLIKELKVKRMQRL